MAHAVDLGFAGEGEGVEVEVRCLSAQPLPPTPAARPSLNALSRLIMGTRWRTSWNGPTARRPTVCVGESGVASDG